MMNTLVSMKPAGTSEIRRRIIVQALIQAADAMAVERASSGLSGVRKVAADLDKHQVLVRYDASQSDYQEIVEILESTGFPPLDNMWDRVRVIDISFAMPMPETTPKHNPRLTAMNHPGNRIGDGFVTTPIVKESRMNINVVRRVFFIRLFVLALLFAYILLNEFGMFSAVIYADRLRIWISEIGHDGSIVIVLLIAVTIIVNLIRSAPKGGGSGYR